MNDNNIINNDRFLLDVNGFNVISDGENISQENIKKYFENQKQMMMIVEEDLAIGDIVKLNKTDDIICLKEINVEFEGNIIAKYGGTKLKSENNNIILFNQEDIKEILYKANINTTESQEKFDKR